MAVNDSTKIWIICFIFVISAALAAYAAMMLWFLWKRQREKVNELKIDNIFGNQELAPEHLGGGGNLAQAGTVSGNISKYDWIFDARTNQQPMQPVRRGGFTFFNMKQRRQFHNVVVKITDEDVEYRDRRTGQSFLHVAVREGMRDEVKFLIEEKKANPMSKDENGSIPLHLAVENLAKDAEIRVDTRDTEPVPKQKWRFGLQRFSNMILGRADNDVEKGDTTKITINNADGTDVLTEVLDATPNPNIKDNDGKTPFQLAVEKGQADAVEVFLKKKDLLDVNSKDNQGRTALHLALGPNSNPDIFMKLVEECDADLNARDNYGQTLLHAAVERESFQAMKLLLGKNADPDSRNDRGKTPLFIAIENSKDEMALELIPKTRDFGMDAIGRSAMYLAAKRNIQEMRSMVKWRPKEEIAEQIRIACKLGDASAYAILTQWNQEQATNIILQPSFEERMHLLSQRSSRQQDRVSIAHKIIQAAAFNSVNRLDAASFGEAREGGHTTLSLACRNGLDKFADLLLSQSYRYPNLINQGSPTPFWETCNSGHNEVLNIIHYILGDQSASEKAPDGTNPLIMAVTKGHRDVVSTLKKYNLYTRDELSKATIRFGSEEMSREIKIRSATPGLFHLAIASGNQVAAEKIEQAIEQTNSDTDKQAISEIKDTFKTSNGTSSLTNIAEEFPKFNDEVEKNVFPELDAQSRNRRELPLKHILDNSLSQFCSIVKKNRESCAASCKQKLECARVLALLTVTDLLRDDLRNNSKLASLETSLTMVGSTNEGSRQVKATEADVCMKFNKLKRNPLRLGKSSDASGQSYVDATRLLIPNGHDDVLSQFVLEDGITFDYPKFLHFLLTEIKKSLLRISKSSLWPKDLSIQADWSPCSSCQKKQDEAKASKYNPVTHCKSCMPCVTHTRLGPCLIFSWQEPDGQKIPLTMDLVPLYPVTKSKGKGVMSFMNTVVKTLLKKEYVEGAAKHFMDVVARDSVLPEQFQRVLRDSQDATIFSEIKLLNYGPDNNCIIRPSQKLDSELLRIDENAELHDVYLVLKGLKEMLRVNISSFFIKKILLSDNMFEELVWNPKEILADKVFKAFKFPELRKAFSSKIDFDYWEQRLKSNEESNLDSIPLFYDALPHSDGAYDEPLTDISHIANGVVTLAEDESVSREDSEEVSQAVQHARVDVHIDA